MFKDSLNNTNVTAERVLVTPVEIKNRIPNSEAGMHAVWNGRQIIERILNREDHRLLVVVGPCSIHDVEEAKDYAQRLKVLHDELGETLYIVMRIYFEKPRTTVGWKGLINDPDLDGTGNFLEYGFDYVPQFADAQEPIFNIQLDKMNNGLLI